MSFTCSKLQFGPLAFVMPEYMIDLETLKKMASRECMQIDVSIAVCMRIYTRIQSVCLLNQAQMSLEALENLSCTVQVSWNYAQSYGAPPLISQVYSYIIFKCIPIAEEKTWEQTISITIS